MSSKKSADVVLTKFGPVPVGSVLSYQQKLDDNLVINIMDGVAFLNVPVQFFMINTYQATPTHEQLVKRRGLNLSKNDFFKFEEKTRLQNQSDLWHKIRRHRVTASQIGKKIYRRRKDEPSLATQLQSSRHVTTSAMWRGIEYEPRAQSSHGLFPDRRQPGQPVSIWR